ncbi:uncharacterized protein [Physcomitrium patens]|uniref:uncharacterized protein isoform X2 n=1 Tax=Physcomitrium patens TaxID=3218 RepID=UPI000D15F046|nr:uncharacterized protein LOC112275336 isoform X2 [Physcomitrium patens]|eukprot:XP_024361395.1 uncharacterized protein LOC112275336 isoform X2 [Physcomitrella patens]
MEEGGGRVMTISEGKQGDEGMAGERRALDSQKSIIDESKDTTQTPTGMEQILTAVAASVMHSASSMSKWSVGDITLGLFKLFNRHSVEKAVDTITGVPVEHKNELDDMLEWLGWATAAYEDKKSTLASTMKVREEDIVKLEATASVLQPAYYIVVHRQRRCVVMGIRGTYTAQDVLTDLSTHSEPFEGGYAHSGMLSAARGLLNSEGQTLHDVLQENPGYSMVVVGHSLGAGTAALLSLLLRETESKPSGEASRVLNIPPVMITCWGFGCPPCVDLNLANSSSFIKNIVLQDDVVARVTPAALEDLRSEMQQTDWSQAFKDGTTKRLVVEMLQATAERFQQKEVSAETQQLYEKTKNVGYSALLSAGNTLLSRISRTKPADVPESQKPNVWLTLGGAAATSFIAAATDRVKRGVNESLSTIEKSVEETNEGEAAAVLAANAATTTSESNQDILVKSRLFVPGLLFHITREPLNEMYKSPAEQNQAEQDPALKTQVNQNQTKQDPALETEDKQNQAAEVQAGQDQANQNHGESKKESPKSDSKTGTEKKTETQKYTYTVVKGTDTNKSRFSRIVLSSSMLSDHSTPAYLEALVNALKNASKGTK